MLDSPVPSHQQAPDWERPARSNENLRSTSKCHAAYRSCRIGCRVFATFVSGRCVRGEPCRPYTPLGLLSAWPTCGTPTRHHFVRGQRWLEAFPRSLSRAVGGRTKNNPPVNFWLLALTARPSRASADDAEALGPAKTRLRSDVADGYECRAPEVRQVGELNALGGSFRHRPDSTVVAEIHRSSTGMLIALMAADDGDSSFQTNWNIVRPFVESPNGDESTGVQPVLPCRAVYWPRPAQQRTKIQAASG